MDPQTIHGWLQNLATRSVTFWQFYMTVVIATVGWLASRKKPFTGTSRTLLTFGLVVFLVSNALGLADCFFRSYSLMNKLPDAVKTELGWPLLFRANVVGAALVHVVLDVLVICFLRNYPTEERSELAGGNGTGPQVGMSSVSVSSAEPRREDASRSEGSPQQKTPAVEEGGGEPSSGDPPARGAF